MTHQSLCRRVHPYINRHKVVWAFWGKPSSKHPAPIAIMYCLYMKVNVKVKVKLYLSTPRIDTGGVKVWRYSFLTSTLGGHK